MNKYYLQYLSLVFILCFNANMVSAQNGFCGAKFTPDQARVMNQVNTHREGGVKPDYCLNKTLSIVAHIFLDSLGQPNITPTELSDAIAVLNEDFKPICLSFTVCKVNYHPNYKYDKFHDAQEGGEVKAIYNVPKMINMYFVIDILDPATAVGPAGGFAPFPPSQDSSDYIVIKKGTPVTGKKTISHEMGHFLGLYHTFESSFGSETNNGSNCATAGDLLCDTPPDANPINITASCGYADSQLDPNGELLTPIIGNIMSYHPAPCKCPFTIMQYNRMAQMYLLFRTYLY